MPVSEIMRHGVITVSPSETVGHVMDLMTQHRARHMPVVHNGQLAGIISIGDVVKYRLDDLQLEASVMRDAYIAAR
jgi:CBS domain-containing protein